MDFKAFEALPGIAVIVKPDAPVYTLVAVSNGFILHSNMKRADVIGKSHFDVFPKSPDDPNFTGDVNLRASFEYILQHKLAHQIPLQRYDIPLSDGSFMVRYWQISNAPILSDDGEVLFIIHTAIDVTDQEVGRQQTAATKGIEKAYHFFMNAPVIIGFVKGDDYIIELANESLLEIWGRTADIIGKPLLSAIPELEEQGFKALLDHVRNTGEEFHAREFPITLQRYGKAEVLYFDFVYKPFYENGLDTKALGVVSVGYDVTAQVLAKKRVKEFDVKYETLFNTMDQGFAVVEMIFDDTAKAIDYRFLETNASFARQTGLENAVGKTVLELVPNLEPHWFELYGSVALTGEKKRFVERSDAMGRWFEVSAFPIMQDDGRKVALLFTDISEKRKADEAVKLSENNLRNVILQSPVAMTILMGPTFIVEIANDRMYELWGRDKEALLNKSIFEGLPEVKNQGYEELLNHVYTTGISFSAHGIPITLPRNGAIETVYINLLYEAFRAGDGTIAGVMGLAVDVTEQVLAVMKIEASNQEFQFVTDFMPQIIWATKPDGYHEFYNKRWYDYTGLSYEQSKNTGWDTVLHEDDKERSWVAWNHSIQTGEPYEIEYRFKRFDGTYRWFLGRALPLRDEAGNILKWYGTCTDIDEQKRSADQLEEKVRLRTHELESQKNELKRSNANLEEFAYAASHDLKEPIRKISTFSSRLRSKLEDKLMPEDKHYFERMERATERMHLLIDDLLEYSHITTATTYLDAVNLNQVIAHVLEDLELAVAEKNARVTVGKLPIIKGHARQLQQLMQNLITNALKFSMPGIPPEISITASKNNRPGHALQNAPGDGDEQDYLLIIVKDNGIGFSQDHAEKIFQMFQRLHGKQDYEGTGIGLAIVRKVVENHKGFISAESEPGEGATFKIYLPAV